MKRRLIRETFQLLRITAFTLICRICLFFGSRLGLSIFSRYPHSMAICLQNLHSFLFIQMSFFVLIFTILLAQILRIMIHLVILLILILFYVYLVFMFIWLFCLFLRLIWFESVFVRLQKCRFFCLVFFFQVLFNLLSMFCYF